VPGPEAAEEESEEKEFSNDMFIKFKNFKSTEIRRFNHHI